MSELEKMSYVLFPFLQRITCPHYHNRGTISSHTILLTSTNAFQIVIGFQTTSYMSPNSCKSKTHDKKKDTWMEFLLAKKWIWCHADTKTRHAAQKYYAVAGATNQTTTMSATGLGCSSSVGAHVIWRFVCLCMCLCMDQCAHRRHRGQHILSRGDSRLETGHPSHFLWLPLMWTNTGATIILRTCGWTCSLRLDVQIQSKSERKDFCVFWVWLRSACFTSGKTESHFNVWAELIKVLR